MFDKDKEELALLKIKHRVNFWINITAIVLVIALAVIVCYLVTGGYQ